MQRATTGLAVVFLLGTGDVLQTPEEWSFSFESARDIALPGWLADLRVEGVVTQGNEVRARAFVVDWNQDGTDDYVIRGSPDACGNAGCPYTVVDGMTRGDLGTLWGNPIFVSRDVVNDYPVVHIYGRSNADSGRWSVWVVDDGEYRGISTFVLTGQSLAESFERVQSAPRVVAGEFVGPPG